VSGLRSRRRGARGEVEVVHQLHALGFPQARRNFGSGSQGGGDITGVPGIHLEVKYQEALNIWAALAQACEEAGTNVPVVAFRRNRSEWYAALPLDELASLFALREA